MTAKVLFLSLSGNTKKVAKAIADEIKCEIFDVNGLNTEEMESFWKKNDETDIFFMGTGVYAGRVGGDLRRFLTTNKPLKPINVALFGTWVGRGKSGPKTFEKFAEYLKKEGHKILGEPYLSFGKMGMFHATHPNEEDLKKARIWAKGIENLL